VRGLDSCAKPTIEEREKIAPSRFLSLPPSSVSAAHRFGSDWRHSRHWLACCWFRPVVNDPKRSSAELGLSNGRSGKVAKGEELRFNISCL
jgi:hypothetical protein